MPTTTTFLLSTLLRAIPFLLPLTTSAVAVPSPEVASQGVSPAVAVTTNTATELDAVVFTVFPSNNECWANQNGNRYQNPDGGCYTLPLARMDVNSVADTCRVFIYASGSCSGNERQVYAGENCVDISSFHTIKVFCH